MTDTLEALNPELHYDSLMTAISSSVLGNRATGQGGARDPFTQNQVGHGPLLGEQELRALYRGSWFIRRIVEMLPQDMTRAGVDITLHGDADDRMVSAAQQIYRDGGSGQNPYNRRMGCGESFRKAMVWARLFGQGYCVMRVNGAEDPSKPLTKVTSFEGLSVLDRYTLLPGLGTINPDRPEFYRVARNESPGEFDTAARLGQGIHESRVLVFSGAMIHPYDIQIEGDGGHDSVIQQMYEVFCRHYQAKTAISKGLDSYSLFKVAISGLSTLMQAPNGTATLTAYLNTVAQQMSLNNILVQDSEASNSEFQERTFTGVADNFRFFLEELAAASGYPHYKVFGSVDKAGLADSGGAESRAYAETVNGNQSNDFGDNHRRLFHGIFESLGPVPTDWEVEYPSIYVPTPEEVAALEKTRAETYKTLVGASIVTKSQVYQAIATGQPLENVCEPLDDSDVLTIIDEVEQVVAPAEDPAAAPVVEPETGGVVETRGAETEDAIALDSGDALPKPQPL